LLCLTELKGVPVEMVAKLVPEHARKQCPWLSLWFVLTCKHEN